MVDELLMYGLEFREGREALGLKQETVARWIAASPVLSARMGSDDTTVSRWETDNREMPRTLVALLLKERPFPDPEHEELWAAFQKARARRLADPAYYEAQRADAAARAERRNQRKRKGAQATQDPGPGALAPAQGPAPVGPQVPATGIAPAQAAANPQPGTPVALQPPATPPPTAVAAAAPAAPAPGSKATAPATPPPSRRKPGRLRKALIGTAIAVSASALIASTASVYERVSSNALLSKMTSQLGQCTDALAHGQEFANKTSLSLAQSLDLLAGRELPPEALDQLAHSVRVPRQVGAGPAAGTMGSRLKIPEHPWKWQKTEPCDLEAAETAIKGGCWVEVGVAPCPPKTFEHGGRCYRPVSKDPGASYSEDP